jgi:hypothetical protein
MQEAIFAKRRTQAFSILGPLIVALALCACQKKEDAPAPNVPHVAGAWAGTGTDDAIGFYNLSMDLTQSGGSAAGSFTMTGGVATVTGNVFLAIGPQGGNNLQALRLTRIGWTVNDPANAGRLCTGDLTVRAGSTAMTSSAISFQYTVTDCAGGLWTGGATLTKRAGTN